MKDDVEQQPQPTTTRRTRTFEGEREVAVAAPQGRPMLVWQGKRPLPPLIARPAQLTDTFATGNAPANPQLWADWPAALPQGGLLFYGDNKDALATMLAAGLRGKVRLIYIDPPFDSGADYVRNVQLRGVAGLGQLEGEAQSLIEQKQYTDIWTNDLYLQFMYERLILLKELLAEDGSIYLHCDQRKVHLLRCLMDEVLGEDNFRSSVARIKTNPKNMERKAFGNIHDYVLFYSKADKPVWNDVAIDFEDEEVIRLFSKTDADGRRYTTTPLHAPGVRSGITGLPWKGINPPAGRHWRMIASELDKLDDKGLIEWSNNNVPRRIVYADDVDGKRIQDVWYMKDPMYEDYPTEKTEEVIRRIVEASSNPGDLILDCFSGSGTTAAVAQKLGRRWVAVDLNRGALQTTSRRLQQVIKEQAANTNQPQQLVVENISQGRGADKPRRSRRKADGDSNPPPAQLGFGIYRVNNYTLDIPYAEAIDLALKSVGAKRLSGDLFFDGTRGDNLVKVVPLDHPLGPLDFEAVKRELEARSGEARSITVVGYGRQQAADEWLKNWNKYRAVARLDEASGVPVEFVNKIEVIDLETDARYGGFLTEQPPTVAATIRREGGEVVVEISGFDSPTIVRRLNMDVAMFNAAVTDWRSLVNSVELDLSYDGAVFDVDYSELPARKNDVVQGNVPNPPAGSIVYRLPVPTAPTRIAVRITDMLGQEAALVEVEI